MPKIPGYWTVAELAEAVARTPQFVRDRITGRQLPKLEAHKIEGRWLIEEPVALRFIESQK